MKSYKYNGPFADSIKGFIEYKRKCRYKYSTTECYLYNFDQFSKNYDDKYLTKEMVDAWITKGHTSDRTKSNYASIIRELGRYLNNIDDKSYIVANKFYPYKADFNPYIFTKEEIKLILIQAEKYTNKRYKGMEDSIVLILRILYGTGMRIGECLSFKISDYNYSKGTVYLSNTKNGTDRIVVLTDKLNDYCHAFNDKYNININNELTFFRNNDAKVIHSNTILYIFKGLLHKCNINLRATIHSVRHTFAVHSFKKLVEESFDMNTILPILSAYLGHVGIKETEKYLHLTTEINDYIRDNNEAGIIKDVIFDEE